MKLKLTKSESKYILKYLRRDLAKRTYRNEHDIVILKNGITQLRKEVQKVKKQIRDLK